MYDDPAVWTMLSAIEDAVGEEHARGTIASLKQSGLIRGNGKMYPGFQLTNAGRSEAERLKARRGDRSYRRWACREALLRWTDAQTQPDDPGSRVARSEFKASIDLEPFSESDMAQAAAFLNEQGFIQSLSTAGHQHLLVWITARGQEAVDGGGAEAFLTSERMPKAVNNLIVTGDGNTVNGAVGEGNQAEQSASSFEVEKTRAFAAAVRQALPSLGLPDEANDLADQIDCGSESGAI